MLNSWKNQFSVFSGNLCEKRTAVRKRRFFWHAQNCPSECEIFAKKRAIRLVKTEAAEHLRTKKDGQDQRFVFRLFECLTEEETTAYCSALAKLCDKLSELKEENDS